MNTSADDHEANGTQPHAQQDDAATAVADQQDRFGSVISRTRTSAIWVTVIVGTIVLIFLLVFILQNLTSVTVTFLGLSGSLPLGVALLFGAVAGALLVALLGAARVLQLRRRVRRTSHSTAR